MLRHMLLNMSTMQRCLHGWGLEVLPGPRAQQLPSRAGLGNPFQAQACPLDHLLGQELLKHREGLRG